MPTPECATRSFYQMMTFTATLKKLGEKGETTGRVTLGMATLGWTYIDIPIAITEALRPGLAWPGQKTSFRVKGTLDTYHIERVALIPMGQTDGLDRQFMMPINATMRRAIRKEVGAIIRVEIEVDESPMPQSADLLACLEDEPRALAFFQTLPKGHQTYFGNWIESAKTVETKAKRITMAVTGLAMGLGYGEMIRYYKERSL